MNSTSRTRSETVNRDREICDRVGRVNLPARAAQAVATMPRAMTISPT